MIPSLPTNASGHNATTRGGVNQERAIIRSSAQRDVRPEPEVSRVSACLPAYTRFTHAVRSPKTDVRSERSEFPWFQKKRAHILNCLFFSFVFFLINLQMRLLCYARANDTSPTVARTKKRGTRSSCTLRACARTDVGRFRARRPPCARVRALVRSPA